MIDPHLLLMSISPLHKTDPMSLDQELRQTSHALSKSKGWVYICVSHDCSGNCFIEQRFSGKADMAICMVGSRACSNGARSSALCLGIPGAPPLCIQHSIA